MPHNLLILAGTTEATSFARAAHEQGLTGTVSFAGRVERPLRQPLPQRIGGFGGADGLASFIEATNISHVIDATHPFAVQMSRNAVTACAIARVPLLALTRPQWEALPGDNWTCVEDVSAAVEALDQPAKNVMLAVGRMHLVEFAPNPQHFYVLRLVDPPKESLPFHRTEVIVDRGPFNEEDDRDLMLAHNIDLVVSKNAGGTGAYAKIAAARSLGLPVIMINRPEQPKRTEVHSIGAAFDWLSHTGIDLGV